MIEFVKAQLGWLVLLIPAACVVWEGLLLQAAGSRRHWRRFGFALYLSGFSLAVGTCFKLKEQDGDSLLAAFFLLLVAGGGLPLVALAIREDERGRVILSHGARIARVIGVFAYVFCATLILEMR